MCRARCSQGVGGRVEAAGKEHLTRTFDDLAPFGIIHIQGRFSWAIQNELLCHGGITP